jgi:DNA repair protein RadC
VIKSLRGVLDYCGTTMSALSTEQLRVLFLNGQNMLLFDSVEDYGSVNTIAIYNRNIIKKALILEASALILIHNHPSRSIRPSQNDI